LLAIARLMNVFGSILQSPRVQAWLVERSSLRAFAIE
jgi:hypothetical protein